MGRGAMDGAAGAGSQSGRGQAHLDFVPKSESVFRGGAGGLNGQRGRRLRAVGWHPLDYAARRPRRGPRARFKLGNCLLRVGEPLRGDRAAGHVCLQRRSRDLDLVCGCLEWPRMVENERSRGEQHLVCPGSVRNDRERAACSAWPPRLAHRSRGRLTTVSDEHFVRQHSHVRGSRSRTASGASPDRRTRHNTGCDPMERLALVSSYARGRCRVEAKRASRSCLRVGSVLHGSRRDLLEHHHEAARGDPGRPPLASGQPTESDWRRGTRECFLCPAAPLRRGRLHPGGRAERSRARRAR